VLNKTQPNHLEGEYNMAEKSLLEQMLERLVNDDQAKAEELFHEYVVGKSREIYENLIEAEMADDEEEEEVDEAAEDEDAEEEKVDEEFEEVAYEGDDEMPPMGGDPTDDLEGEMGPEEDGDLADESEEELFQDLDSIVDELQSRFDALGGGDEAGADMGDEMGDDEMKDNFDLATVREYVEKVPGGHGVEKKGEGEGKYSGTGTQSDSVNVNAKSIVAGKNDMGGTTANILSSRNGADSGEVGAGRTIKGSALNGQKPKEDNAGNINVPGGKAGGAFSTKEPGHGAEKKGEAEGKFSGTGGSSGSVDKASLFRGRR
jgi:hypothetical protein